MRAYLLAYVIVSVVTLAMAVREWVDGPEEASASTYRRSRNLALALAALALVSVGTAVWLSRHPGMSGLAPVPLILSVLVAGVGRVHMIRGYKSRPRP